MPRIRRLVVFGLHPLEDDRLAVSRQLHMGGVERTEIEQFLLPIVVSGFLEIVGRGFVDGVDVGLGRVPHVSGRFVRLAAELECRSGASQMKVDRHLRLLEAVFLEIGRRRRTGDERLHLGRLDAAYQAIDG